MHIKQVFANEAKENADLKLKLASSGEEKSSSASSTTNYDYDMNYDELKRKYNTLNEKELQEIMARNRESKERRDDASSGLPSASDTNRPIVDRSLKPSQQLKQGNKYNLRTVK